MAESVLKLKKQAVELGADKEWAVKALRPALEEFIASAGKKKSSKKTAKKSATKTTKKTAAKKSAAKKTEKPKADAKVSKSKKTAKKNSAGSKKAPADKSAKAGKAKRPTTKSSKADKDAGRVLISGIDWSVESDDWKPRENSPVMRLFKALKKVKGNVDKAFDALEGDVFDFVGKTKRDGTKRTKAEAHAMLRYRLNRTKFEFATRTGQHVKGGNRVKYGTGAHATATKKAAKKEKAASKPKTSTKKKSSKKK